MAAAKAKKLRELLRAREITIAQLCAAVPISVTHFSHILNDRRDGRCTWPKLKSLLTDEEQAAVTAAYGQVFD